MDQLEWKQSWSMPPRSFEDYRVWKIYCRIWKDVGLVAPGTWIHLWLRSEWISRLDFEENARMTDAINYYVNECRE